MNKLGFIGFGNMAYAIAKGILQEQIVKPSSVFVFDISDSAKQNATECGFVISDSEKSVVEMADIIFLCVKPQCFTDVLSKINNDVSSKIFVSIAAGISILKISNSLNNAAVIRAMPNTPLLLAKGTTALTRNNTTSDIAFDYVKKIFKSVGSVYELPENKFNEVINVNGSTPAYIYYFAKVVSEFAEDSGINYNTAMNMFCDTLVGSAKMLTNSNKSAQELIDMVSSKGGTTVAALDAMREAGFENSLRVGMTAALKRAQELGELN